MLVNQSRPPHRHLPLPLHHLPRRIIDHFPLFYSLTALDSDVIVTDHIIIHHRMSYWCVATGDLALHPGVRPPARPVDIDYRPKA